MARVEKADGASRRGPKEGRVCIAKFGIYLNVEAEFSHLGMATRRSEF